MILLIHLISQMRPTAPPLDSRVRGNHHGLVEGHIRGRGMKMEMAPAPRQPLDTGLRPYDRFAGVTAIFMVMTMGAPVPSALPKVYGGRVRRYRTRVDSGCRRSCGTMPSVLGTGRRGMTAEDLMNGQPLLEVDGLRVYFPITTGLMRRARGYVRAVGRELQPAEGRDRPARSAGVAK